VTDVPDVVGIVTSLLDEAKEEAVEQVRKTAGEAETEVRRAAMTMRGGIKSVSLTTTDSGARLRVIGSPSAEHAIRRRMKSWADKAVSEQ